MSHQLTEDIIDSVMQQIRTAPEPLAVSQLTGDRETNLLAVRELNLRGAITGIFLDDPNKLSDHNGPFLYDAGRLEPR